MFILVRLSARRVLCVISLENGRRRLRHDHVEYSIPSIRMWETWR